MRVNNRQKTAREKLSVRPGDARNKIIHKRRTQIADLRDKLSELSKQKDVRLKLEQMRLKKSSYRGQVGRNAGVKYIQENRRNQRNLTTRIHQGFVDLSRQVKPGPLSAPPNFNIDRQIGYRKLPSLHSDRIGSGLRTPKPILRTVENDVYQLSKAIVIDDDYDMESGPRPALNLKIIATNDNAWDKGFTTKSSEKREERMPPSILKKRPMAALRMDRERRRTPPPASPPPAPAAPEYRIIVSNLRSSVTGTDIQELFGDIGGLTESRLVRPGTAEVIYSSREDAQRAVDLYHNRQLDGQPMNCLLVNPRAASVTSSGRLGASAKSPQAAGASSIVPDIDTFHKVLFSNRR